MASFGQIYDKFDQNSAPAERTQSRPFHGQVPRRTRSDPEGRNGSSAPKARNLAMEKVAEGNAEFFRPVSRFVPVR